MGQLMQGRNNYDYKTWLRINSKKSDGAHVLFFLGPLFVMLVCWNVSQLFYFICF